MLTEKEQRFVRAYLGEAAGNGAKAAVLAGYAPNSAKVTASRLLTRANVAAALETARRKLEKASIADATERREIATSILRDADAHPIARLKASDQLNKMDGLYVQRLEHSGAVSVVRASEADERL